MNKCCCECIGKIIGHDDRKLPSIVVSILTVLLQLFAVLEIGEISKIYTNTPTSIASKVFPIVLIIMLLIAYLVDKKRKDKEQFANIKKTRRRPDAKDIKNAIKE